MSELESEARLREERLEHTTQQMAAAQDNLQVDAVVHSKSLNHNCLRCEQL